MARQVDADSNFSPYRPDGKLLGFICIVTGVDGALGKAIVRELAGSCLMLIWLIEARALC